MVSRLKSKTVLVLLVVAALAAVGLALKPDSKKAPPSSSGTGSSTQPAPGSQQLPYTGQYIDTPSYKYPRPVGWAKLSKEVLAAISADSGIGYISQNVTFTIQTSPSTPVNDEQLKKSTLEVLQKLSQFNLQETVTAKVDNATGQKFIFTATNEAGKFKKEMSVVINKKKTYFLLTAAPEESYPKYQADFDVILANFKFK